MASNQDNPHVRRVGMVIGIKPDKIEEYKALHADSHPGVRHLLSKYHIRNFSIFLHQLDDGRHYLFGNYEYDGYDFEGDMARLDKEARNQEWHAMTDAMQIPLRGEKLWANMTQVYYNA